MSVTLWALVTLQLNTFAVDPGYESKSECEAMYKGQHTLCFPYDPDLKTWSMFFKLPSGGIKTGRGFTSRDECETYIGAFKTDIPAICRPLAFPATCTLACVKPIEPPPPPPPPPAAKPAPQPETLPNPDPANIQIDGKQYTRVAGLAWTPVTEDQPAPPPMPPKQRTAERRTRQPQPQQFDPIGAFVGVITAPIRFATYPARRNW